jgi:plasmid maintenance system antidote protein VapI
MTLNRLKGIVLGKGGITADTALRLVRSSENVFALWMRMQADWDWHEAVQRETRRAS